MPLPQPSLRRSAGLLIGLLAALLALAVSIYLASGHLRKPTDAVYKGMCDPNASFLGMPVDCAKVNNSEYGELAGVPVSLLGAGFYLSLAGLSLVAWRMRSESAMRAQALFSLGAGFGVLYSLYLFHVQFNVLEAFCPFCLMLYGCNTLLLAGALIASGFRPGPLIEAGREMAGRFFMEPVLLATCVGFLLTVGAGHLLLVSQQERLDREASILSSGGGDLRALLAKSEPLQPSILPDDPRLGPENAPYTVVEFSDFRCPFCRVAADRLKAVKDATDRRMRLVFKHYPLDSECNPNVRMSLHPGACLAARAAVCAAQSDRFWEYHDELFARQDHLYNGDVKTALVDVASQVGLSRPAFTSCLEDPASLERVKRDVAEGARLQVGGTPSFLVNGHPLYRPPLDTGEGSLDKVRSIIEKNLLDRP